MPAEIEMQDLKATDNRQEADRESESEDVRDYTITTWAWVATTLFSLLALCLIISPRLLLFVSETANDDERRTALTPLESFLALQFGIFLLAVSSALLLNIPSVSPMQTALHERNASPTHPLLGPVAAACALSSFISYNTKHVGPLAILFCLGSGFVSLWSFWVVLFADSSLVSKKTGADKHTSSFIFGNKASASAQKKKWRKEQTGKTL
ncbi:hypothetical protein FIBSPDRAFT_828050 [Athelia psychrophila]|uniref:Transmembrane protein n=1 Tax=Athelia psychrophila TaxID=1759441 RepID=A0A166I2Y9_9AGAM|nr:hypothetical protein FIBSPDRAFT_828050 [Fibularhizoctonia sp. CBS 109695]